MVPMQYQGSLKSSQLVCSMLLLLIAMLSACEPTSDVDHLSVAKKQYQDNKYKESIISLKNALKRNQDNADARYLLAKVYLEFLDGQAAEKEFARAQKHGFQKELLFEGIAKALNLQRKFQAAIEVLEDWDAVTPISKTRKQMLLAEAYIGLEQYNKAQALIKLMISSSDFGIETLLLQATLYARQNKIDEAVAVIEKIINKNPGHVRALLILSDLQLMEGKTGDTIDTLRRALAVELQSNAQVYLTFIRLKLANSLLSSKKYKEGERYVDEILQTNGNNPNAKYLKATLAYKNSDLKKARDILQQVLQYKRDHKPALLLLGAINFSEGNLEQVDLYLNQVLSDDAENPTALRILGAAQLKRKNPGQAIEILSPVVKRAPDDLQSLNIMGLAHWAQGDLKTGIRYFEKARELRPQSADVGNKLAMAYLSIGDVDQAIVELEDLKKSGSVDYRSKSLLVLSYVRKGRLERSAQLAKSLYEQYEDNPHALNVLATVYMAQTNKKEAYALLKSGMEKHPSDEFTLRNLLRLTLVVDGVDGAYSLLKKFVSANPNSETAVAQLALLHIRTGNLKLAIELLEGFIAFNPKNVNVRVLKARILLANKRILSAHKVLKEAVLIEPDNTAINFLMANLDLNSNKLNSALLRVEKILSDKSFAQGYFLKARIQAAQGESTAAISSLEKALQIKPQFDAALWLLAELNLRVGSVSRVKNIVRDLKKQRPDSPMIDVLLGDIAYSKKRYSESLQRYTKAAKKFQHSDLIKRQYNSLKKTGADVDAAKLLRKWLDRYKNDLIIRKLYAFELQSSGNLKAAAEQYKQVIDSGSEDPGVFNNLAWLTAGSDRAQALKYARRAYGYAPHNAAVVDTLGWLYVQEGEFEKGLNLLQEAVGLNSSNPDIIYHYSFALVQTRQITKAKKLLEKALGVKEFENRKAAQKLFNKIK